MPHSGAAGAGRRWVDHSPAGSGQGDLPGDGVSAAARVVIVSSLQKEMPCVGAGKGGWKVQGWFTHLYIGICLRKKTHSQSVSEGGL